MCEYHSNATCLMKFNLAFYLYKAINGCAATAAIPIKVLCRKLHEIVDLCICIVSRLASILWKLLFLFEHTPSESKSSKPFQHSSKFLTEIYSNLFKLHFTGAHFNCNRKLCRIFERFQIFETKKKIVKPLHFLLQKQLSRCSNLLKLLSRDTFHICSNSIEILSNAECIFPFSLSL